jgi:polar amino acid transport system substrate-binding protein
MLLTHRQHAPINNLHDLYGKTLGTELGYVYSAGLMSAFASHQITRKDLRDSASGLNLLGKQRLDAIIDMRRSLQFQLAQNPEAPLQLNQWVIKRYDMHCTYSPQLPVNAKQLDQVLQELHDQGLIEQMLSNI